MMSHPHPPIWTDAATVCEDAFVFAFPLVLMELARAHMTAVARPEPATMRAPPNRLVHAHTTTDARPRCAPRPGSISATAPSS
jgi:hypothetical protein